MVDNVCMKCSSTDNVKVIDILPLRYGSRFDEWGTKICLCDKCLNNSPFKSIRTVIDKDLQDNSIATDEYLLVYENEDDMFSYVESLTLENQEKFFNQYAYGSMFSKIDKDEWVKWESVRCGMGT